MKRRDFIHKSAAVAAGTGIISSLPGTAQAASRILGANEKITVGAIGLKGMGWSDLNSFLKNKGENTHIHKMISSELSRWPWARPWTKPLTSKRSAYS